jgi:hypothetical protein
MRGWEYSHAPPATTRHMDPKTIHIDRRMLKHFSPKVAIYLTLVLHLDDCARVVAVGEDGIYKGWFHLDRNFILNASGMSMKKQTAALRVLKTLGILQVRRKGVPARNFCYVKVDRLMDLTGIAHGELRELLKQ